MASSEDAALASERQAAARRLLADPIVTIRTHPEDFAAVRTHSDWLIQQFNRVLGYELTVAAEYARLSKVGLVSSVAQPPRRSNNTPFSPRTYSYLALSLAALVDSAPRIALTQLAEGVREAASEAGLALDPTSRMSERRAFMAAVRFLADIGAVSARGDTLAASGVDRIGEAVLDVHSDVLCHVVAHPPHATSDPLEFRSAMEADDPSGDAAAEVALRRLIAETAVVYRDDLPERQRERLGHHQWRAVAELGALLGCDAEIRAEGVALVMPDDTEDESFAVFPSSEPAGQAALLLMERIIARIPVGGGPAWAVPVPSDLLESELTRLLEPESELRQRWGRTALSHVPDPDHLAARILDLLGDSGLMRRLEAAEARYEGWSVLAAAARYCGRPYHFREVAPAGGGEGA